MILDREEGREREKHWSVASCRSPDQRGTRSLGVCPDHGPNPQPFGVWDDALTNWATWPELTIVFKLNTAHWKCLETTTNTLAISTRYFTVKETSVFFGEMTDAKPGEIMCKMTLKHLVIPKSKKANTNFKGCIKGTQELTWRDSHTRQIWVFEASIRMIIAIWLQWFNVLQNTSNIFKSVSP